MASIWQRKGELMAGNPKRRKVKVFSGSDLAKEVGKESVGGRKKPKKKRKK